LGHSAISHASSRTNIDRTGNELQQFAQTKDAAHVVHACHLLRIAVRTPSIAELPSEFVFV